MLGAVIGDIIGSVYEWDNIKTKEFDLFSLDCMPTDDSIMTLAIAKSLCECKQDYSNLKEITINNMVMIGRMYINCGFGRGFKNWILGESHEPYNSYGNGSAMRVSPVAMVAKSLDEVKKLSRIVTEVSHNHPEGIKGAEAIAVATYMARNGKTLDEIRDYIVNNYYKIDFTIDEIRDFYSFSSRCEESVPQALEAFFESTSFEYAIRIAISIGGDSDTIAAMTGGVAGAYYGIPKDISNLAEKFLDENLLKISKMFDERIEIEN